MDRIHRIFKIDRINRTMVYIPCILRILFILST